ncbi:MAG: TIGR02466 family protein [Pseudomonadota bacterium]|nr:TIGR02466 family protein [Pseudomonadota bacterium]
MTAVRAWFPTLIYSERLQARGLRAFNAELLDECRRIRDFDEAGQAWSARSYPLGYTSYGSLDRLQRFSSTFDVLRQRIDPHVASYARALDWDLRGGCLEMTDCWLNIMPQGCSHSFHVHPHAVVSGTYYVDVPRGSPGLKFEDPRLTKMMAAPARRARGRPDQRAHIEYRARAGDVILFESWLRHEVSANPVGEERVSISFNYHWR